jgi:hypothetical protein
MNPRSLPIGPCESLHEGRYHYAGLAASLRIPKRDTAGSIRVAEHVDG